MNTLAHRPLRISEPVIGSAEIQAVAETMEAGWISGYGPAVERFERDFSEYCGVAFGIATANGTVALHLALAALEVGEGDEVIIPAFSMISVFDAVSYTGATAVLCDSEAETWNIDPQAVKEVLTPRTRAVIAVHTYGLPCDIAELREAVGDKGVTLVEDAAEAHGAELGGARAGSLGDISCFSFFANKIITTGEGGMVLTGDAELARQLRSLCDLSRTGHRAYEHERVGFNYRLSALQAALGNAQLARIDEFVVRRRANARRYEGALAGIPGLSFRQQPAGMVGSDWMTGILSDDSFGAMAVELAQRLAARGIETRPFFLPIHQQPFWRVEGSFLVAESLAAKGLLLPSGNDLRDEDVDYVCETILSGASTKQ